MVKTQKLSPEQDMAANPSENIWVQANAGTGKTSVLTQRLLRILFRTPDCGTSGILCLTYTNAGAGEMRNRILKSLRTWAMSSDQDLQELLIGVATHKTITDADISHARKIFFQYIDHPEILKIKTIHGFCEEILHRFPLEAGLSPSWSLVSDAAQRVLLQDTFRKLINSPSADQKIHDAFAYITNRVSETYLDDLLKILSEQYKLFFRITDIVKYRQQFVDTTKKLLNITDKKFDNFDPSKLQYIIEIASNEQNAAKKPAAYLNDIIEKTKQFINTTIDFEEYKSAYLTATGTPKKTVSKKDYLIAEQERVYALDQQNANQTLFQDTVALFDLSAAFASQYQQSKQAKNLLDFEDLILYTQKLFSSPDTMGWILSQLDTSLSHILVDEAQDTSPIQWDILRMLAGDFFTDGDTSDTPHSLFVVGDTKQSIYGFQGADPNAFASSRHDIAAHIQNNLRTIKEIPLTQSFRSTKAILGTVDKFFDDPTIKQETGFHNNTHKCFRTDAPGVVEIHKLISKPETDTTTNQYAHDIALKIKDIIDGGKYSAKDIMVLIQQRNPLAAPLTRHLKQLNIDVAGSDRIILPNFPAIKDMLNMVRWCLNHDDDFSLCCVLRSPFFAMNSQEIFNICKTRNTLNKQRTPDQKPIAIYEILRDMHPDIHEYLSRIADMATHMSPYSFFSHILNTDNTRQRFISALGQQIIDPLEEFMTICLAYERTQPGTLRHFLKWFITGDSEIKRDMDATSGVRIVTVHGSKGLEAPVVFLIDTIRTPKASQILTLTQTPMPQWIWSPKATVSEHFKTLSEPIKQEQLAEYYRLLYVAMTRARDELYIYGYTTNKNPPIDAWHTKLWNTLTDNPNAEYIRITNDDFA